MPARVASIVQCDSMGVTVTQSDTGKPATLGHVIGGKVVTAARGTVPVFDPATGVETAVTALASDETAAAAVEASGAAISVPSGRR